MTIFMGSSPVALKILQTRRPKLESKLVVDISAIRWTSCFSNFETSVV